MKHCLPCNLNFSNDRHFCGSCGGSLTDSTTCQFCGDIIESKWKFCTGCGNTLGRAVVSETLSIPASAVESAGDSKRLAERANSSTPEWYAAPELLPERDEITVESRRPGNFNTQPPPRKYSAPVVATSNGEDCRKGKDVPTLSMLSAYGESEPATNMRPAIRYPLVVSLALITVFAIVSFGGWYVWAHRAAAGSAHAERAGGEEQSAMGNQFSQAPVDETSSNRRSVENADDEWQRLKKDRIEASKTDQETIVEALEQAEKKYPGDYRFPYERAKLLIKGVTSHHEAFAALAVAAEKAIDNGKTQEMLDSLLADENGDFWKPSHGHHEWPALLQALEHKDKTDLNELRH